MPLLEGKQVDDIAFFRALIERLVASDRVDPRRIYLLGVSNGALMAYRVACEMGREIAAIAALISPMSDLQQEDCPPGSPIPLFILAGNADTAQSYLGASGPLQGRLVSVPDTVRFFRARYGCTGMRSEELPHRDPLDRTTITLFRPQVCPSGAEIVFYRVNGGGHRVPTLASGDYEPHPQFGLANRDVDAAAEAWAFFRRFVRN
jgi:polyhydroxybutyrate depolymerase